VGGQAISDQVLAGHHAGVDNRDDAVFSQQ
jgi:hypothetical protein